MIDMTRSGNAGASPVAGGTAPADDADAEAQLADFQNRLHQALEALTSGAIIRPATSWRGWRRAHCHPAWIGQLAAIEARCAGRHRAARMPAIARPTFADAAGIIARGYAAFAEALKSRPGIGVPAPLGAMVDWYDSAARRGDALRPVRELRSWLRTNCADELRAAYVHGSFSTGDFNAYSDLDTLVVLRAEVVTDPGRLLTCALRLIHSCRFLLECDLLQHHGHFALTEIDFDWYCDAHFPSVLFPRSTQILGDDTLGIGRTRDSSKEAWQHLESRCRRFLSPPGTVRLRGAFELKLYLSYFMILPSLLLQARGKPCYKRESFERVRSFYGDDVFRVMDEVSDLRAAWRQTRSAVLARVAALSPIVRGALFYRQGAWGVPAGIFERVRSPEFQQRLAAFAASTLDIAHGQRQAG